MSRIKDRRLKRMDWALYNYFKPFYKYLGKSNAVSSSKIVDDVLAQLKIGIKDDKVYGYYRNRIISRLFNLIRDGKAKYALIGMVHFKKLDVDGMKKSFFYYPESDDNIREMKDVLARKGNEYQVSGEQKSIESKRFITALSAGIKEGEKYVSQDNNSNKS